MPKDKLVRVNKHGDGMARVKPIKDLGDGVRSFTVKNPDKSTYTFRYRNTNQEDANYNPKPLKPKKTKRMKSKRIPRKLKNIKAPGYVSPEVTLDKKTQAIADARDRAKNTSTKKKILKKVKNIKLPKVKKGRKVRKTRNLVTGKLNKTRG